MPKGVADPYRVLALSVINQAIVDCDTGWLNGKSKTKTLFFEVAELTIDELWQKRCRACLKPLDEGSDRRHRGNLCYVCDLQARVKRLTNKQNRML